MRLNTLAIVFSLFALAISCDFMVHLVSDTQKPFYIEMVFFNESKSELIHMKKKGDTKVMRIVGDSCSFEPTFVRTYSDAGKESGKDALITSSFLDGTGVLNYVVGDDLQPRMKMRVGVLCGFGDCGHG